MPIRFRKALLAESLFSFRSDCLLFLKAASMMGNSKISKFAILRGRVKFPTGGDPAFQTARAPAQPKKSGQSVTRTQEVMPLRPVDLV
ncbi:hypothetical protein SAMN05444162_0232 [Paenibacillaceae bacterium GAS479]|nr:hypothetical protein SAMN05444162_0232 [Paenibacillaceae bacterium GAS479]